MSLKFTRESRVLFIGDSITDCGRRTDPLGLGNGYVRIIHDYLAAKDPAHAPRVINMGISGNKVTDLRDRWTRDVLEQKPDVLSIKIGINDVWHGFKDPPDGVSIETFVGIYHALLRQVHSALPLCKVVLFEPSVIGPPAPADGNKLLQPYVRGVNELGRGFHAQAVVPLHGLFLRAQQDRPDIAWTPDGVHPSSAGHMLIARAWLSTLKLL